MLPNDHAISEMVEILLGRRTPRMAEAETEGVVPPFLVAPYARESTARESADLEHLPTRLLSALVRAAFEDEEEDVRAAARHTLIVRGSGIGDVIHLALTMDRDPYVRESALDEALEIEDDSRRQRLIQQAVQALINDECEFVRKRALEFAQASILSTRALKDDD